MRFVKSVNQCKDILATYTGKFRKNGKTFAQLFKEHLSSPINGEAWVTKAKFLGLSSSYLEDRVLGQGSMTQMRGGKKIPVNRMVFKNASCLVDIAKSSLPSSIKLELFKHLSCLFVASYIQSNYPTNLGEAVNFLEEDLGNLNISVNPELVTRFNTNSSWRRRNDPIILAVRFVKGVFMYPLDGVMDLIAVVAPTFLDLGIQLGDIPRELLLSPWVKDHNHLWNIKVQHYADCVDVQSWDNLQKEYFVRSIIEYLATHPSSKPSGFVHGAVPDQEYVKSTEDFVYSFSKIHGINVNTVETQRMFGEHLNNVETPWKNNSWSGIRDKEFSKATLMLKQSPVSAIGHPENILGCLLGSQDKDIKIEMMRKVAEFVQNNMLSDDSMVLDVRLLAQQAAENANFNEFLTMAEVPNGYAYRRNLTWELDRHKIALASAAKPDKVFGMIKEMTLEKYERARENLEGMFNENKAWLKDIPWYFHKLGVFSDPGKTVSLYCSEECPGSCNGSGHYFQPVTIDSQGLPDKEFWNVTRIIDSMVNSLKDRLIKESFSLFSRLSNVEVAEVQAIDVGDIF